MLLLTKTGGPATAVKSAVALDPDSMSDDPPEPGMGGGGGKGAEEPYYLEEDGDSVQTEGFSCETSILDDEEGEGSEDVEDEEASETSSYMHHVNPSSSKGKENVEGEKMWVKPLTQHMPHKTPPPGQDTEFEMFVN
jgi:hypothetical protein